MAFIPLESHKRTKGFRRVCAKDAEIRTGDEIVYEIGQRRRARQHQHTPRRSMCRVHAVHLPGHAFPQWQGTPFIIHESLRCGSRAAHPHVTEPRTLGRVVLHMPCVKLPQMLRRLLVLGSVRQGIERLFVGPCLCVMTSAFAALKTKLQQPGRNPRTFVATSGASDRNTFRERSICPKRCRASRSA